MGFGRCWSLSQPVFASSAVAGTRIWWQKGREAKGFGGRWLRDESCLSLVSGNGFPAIVSWCI